MPDPPIKRYTPGLVGENYIFLTDDGRIYEVSFEEQPFIAEEDEFPMADKVYELFLNLQDAPPAYSADPRIGITLTAIIQNFIQKDPLRIIFYTCDTADGRHAARYRRFNDWFIENNRKEYIRLEDSIVYPAIDKLFLITVLLELDHPYAKEIPVAFFRLTKRLRAQK